MNAKLNRRQTLKGLAALATIQILPGRLLGLNGKTPPSEELTRGIIGCGGISASHLTMPGRLLALCDVRRQNLDQRMVDAGGADKGITPYHDFRELLARKDIDIVHIATPPHWHALMSIAAAEAGKDVWCEKPMTRTIGEGQAVVEAIKRTRKIFRINTWFRFQGGFYGMNAPVSALKKVIVNGMLGWPLRFTVSAHTGFDWKLSEWAGKPGLPPDPVPDGFDYDLWLGPAPQKPHTDFRTSPHFRGYWDYDGGGLGDMGQHYLDPIQYLLDKDDESPISVEIDSDPQDEDAVGVWRRIEFTYADGCKIVLDGDNSLKDAAYIEGPKGKIMRGFQSDIPDFRKLVKSLPEPPPQETDFHKCVHERRKFALNEENAFRSCTMVNMAKIAFQLNKNLKFNPKTFQFDDPAANSLLNPPMRGPWQLG